MNHKLSLLLCVLLAVVATVFGDGESVTAASESGWVDVAYKAFLNLLPNIVVGGALTFLGSRVALLGLGGTWQENSGFVAILVGYPIFLSLVNKPLEWWLPGSRFPNGAVLMDRLFWNWVDLVFIVASEYFLGFELHSNFDYMFYAIYFAFWIIADVVGLYLGRTFRFALSCIWPVISLGSLVLSQTSQYARVGMLTQKLVDWFIVPQDWSDAMIMEKRITTTDGNAARPLSGKLRVVLTSLVTFVYPVYYWTTYEGQRSLSRKFWDYYGQPAIMALPSPLAGASDIVDKDDGSKGQSVLPSASLPSAAEIKNTTTSAISAVSSKIAEKKGAVKESIKHLEKDLGANSASTMVSGMCGLLASIALVFVL